MEIRDIYENLKSELIRNTDEKNRKVAQHYFKEKIECYGIKANLLRQISRDYFKLIKEHKKEEVFEICEMLLQSGYIEESSLAGLWSYQVHKQYEPEDFKIFEHWISNYISNWAACDGLCNHTVGEFLEMYPHYVEKLKGFARSPNLWKRRSAAVSLIIPAKKGMFLDEVFEIADILLTDKEDMVQKGVGWMLKVAGNKHEQHVFNYIVKNKGAMPRTALRYAIEKMPQELRKIAMS